VIIDDGILDHPKFIRAVNAAGSSAIHLWLGIMSWCKQQLTDGVIPVDVLPKVHGPPPRWRARALDALLEHKLIERVNERELRVHDFLDWNKSREQVESESAVRRHSAKARRDRLRRASEVGVTSHREPTDVEVMTDRGTSEVVPTSDRERAVSNDNAELSARVLTPYPTLPIPNLSDPDPPLTPQTLEPVPPPQPESQSASTGEARRGRRSKPRARSQCPLDLKPDETTDAKAWELGFTQVQLDAVVAEFVDYWRCRGDLRADWQAGLRNRLRDRAERLGLKPRKPRDERWAAYQTSLRKANEPITNAVPAPPEFERALGGLFGG